MILLCDEGVDGPIVDKLRAAGFEVLYVAEMDPGLSDDSVLELANAKGALLVTADKDFGELVYRQKRASAGVMLVRLAGVKRPEKGSMVLAALREHGHQLLGAFSVVSRGRVRIRPAGAPPA